MERNTEKQLPLRAREIAGELLRYLFLMDVPDSVKREAIRLVSEELEGEET